MLEKKVVYVGVARRRETAMFTVPPAIVGI